jgi:hypothetical protein
MMGDEFFVEALKEEEGSDVRINGTAVKMRKR